MTPLSSSNLVVRLANSDQDIKAAQRLRYDVFVQELGAKAPWADHKDRLEADGFDDKCEHLLLVDLERDPNGLDYVVGAYRLCQGPRFYSEAEFDLQPLRKTGLRLLELGRSCLAQEYRGGAGMLLLWQNLAHYVEQNQIDIVFGVASFHQADPELHLPSLTILSQRYLAPENLRTRAIGESAYHFDPAQSFDAREAMICVPQLIKSYLKMGCFIGEGAYVDHNFNTVDICIMITKDRMLQSFAKGLS